MRKEINLVIGKICVALIHCYKWLISPWIQQSCIFQPTCSSYAIEAFKKYNVFKAIWLTIRRISRCHAFYKGSRDDPLK